MVLAVAREIVAYPELLQVMQECGLYRGGRLTADHDAAARSAAQPPLQQCAGAPPRSWPGPMVLQPCLHLLPQGRVQDGCVLAGVDLLPVTDLAAVGDVTQELTQAVP